jgi:hypothetical protein
MAVNQIDYSPNIAGEGTTPFRGPSKVIWKDCPVLEILEDPSKGMYFFDDFIMVGSAITTSAYKNSIGQWATYTDATAGGSQSDGAKEGGVLVIGADGDNEEVTMFSQTGAFRLVTTTTLALNRKLWFECRIARSTVTATKGDIFVGLALPALTSNIPASAQIISATDNTLNTTSLLGFHLKGNGPTEANFAFCLSGGTVNYPTGMTTLMNSCTAAVNTAAAFHKFGFLFDPDGLPSIISSATARQTAGNVRKKLIRVFVDGLECATFLSSDDVANATATQAFPTSFMSPTISIMNQTGSTPDTLSIDWIRVCQLANT